MPEENKIKKGDPQVDIDTSGPDVDINLPEEKEETTGGINDIQVEEKTTEQETEKEIDKTFENERETKLEEGGEVETKEEKKDDEKLEDYSKGVQSRIAKLTRKMREAERREKAAVEYARAVEERRKTTETKFSKVNDWIMFARYAGSRIKIDGGEMRLLNDDEVLATIDSPEDILHEF